jgi:hypothetical protein
VFEVLRVCVAEKYEMTTSRVKEEEPVRTVMTPALPAEQLESILATLMLLSD